VFSHFSDTCHRAIRNASHVYRHFVIVILLSLLFWYYYHECSYALASCPSLRYFDHIGWNTSKIFSLLIILESSLSADSNIVSLFQREHHEILAGIGVGYGKSGSQHMNYVMSSTKLYQNFHSLRQHCFLVIILLAVV